MNSTDSVIVQLRLLEQGDPQAAEELWNRYFSRLVRFARSRLGNEPRRDFDEEDVALSVFHNLTRCAQDQRLTEIVSREQLWRLLVTFTAQKVIDKVRASRAEKRGSGNVRGESVFGADSGGARAGLDLFFGSDPTPEMLLEMEEQFEELMAMLPDDVLRKIALQRMHGYSNDEIAEQLGVSPRTIERKFQIIRSTWEDRLNELS